MDIWSTEQGASDLSSSDTERLLRDSPPINGVAPTEDDPGVSSRKPDGVPVLYTRRWYILALFSMNAFTMGIVWNTWGPISRSASTVYGWSDADFSLLSNWGPITYLLSTPVFIWLMDVKGMRWATLALMVFTTAGTALRCVPTRNTTAATWLINAGQLLNGIGGPVSMGGAPALSAVWFPAHERITATALAAGFNGMGAAVGFIIGPLIVPDSAEKPVGHRISEMFGTPIVVNSTDTGDLSGNVAQIHAGIMKLMYIEFGFSAFLLLLTVLYFPNKPPSPPSISASQERISYKNGMKKLISMPMIWVLAFIYAVPGGVYGGFQSVLEVILKEKGVSQDLGGWVGFYATLAGCVGGLVIGRFADIFKRQMKLYLMLFTVGTIAAAYVFAIAYEGCIPFTKEVLYASNVFLGLFLMASIPLVFELGCEMSYPVAEGLTNGFMTWMNNLAGLVFLLILMVPNIGTGWVTWFVLGSNAVALPCLLLLRERYGRLNIDIAAGDSRTRPAAAASGGLNGVDI